MRVIVALLLLIAPSLATATNNDKVGDFGTAIGFGKTSNGGSSSAILRKFELPTISIAACDKLYTEFYDGMICTSTPGKSA